MGWQIQIAGAHYEQLREHLQGDIEQVAFLFTDPYAGDQRLRVRTMQLIAAEGFNYQSGYHVELTDETRPELIKRAWREDACLIEVHSHLHGPAQFSASDLTGFEEWVPHMRWRLQGRPYAALVFAPEDFDALIWDQQGRPNSLDALKVIGGVTLCPTQDTHRAVAPAANRKPWWRRIFGR